MRITGGRLIDVSAAATTANQGKVAEAASELSSGLRVEKPSEDPTAWIAAQRARLRKSLSEGTGMAMQFSRDRLSETDRALGTVQDALSSVRTLAIQGANDSYNADSRKGMAIQVRALFDVARAAANTQSVDGEYLLAGSSSLTEPFDANGAYTGNATTRAVPTTELATSVVTVSGDDLTATNGVDVLPLLGRVATALENNDVTTLRGLLTDLDKGISQMSLARGRGGAAMAVLDEAALAHDQLEQNMSTDIARYVETDAVKAASELARSGQALQASSAVSQHVISLLNRMVST